MNLDAFVDKYAHNIDDAMLRDGVKDGVVVIEDLASALRDGVFGDDQEAASYVENLIANPDSPDTQSLLNYQAYAQALSSQSTPASLQLPVDNTSDLMSFLSGPSANTGCYSVPGLGMEKSKLIDAAQAEGATREETAWLLAHAMIEDEHMQGTAGGAGKSSDAYNVGIFNMSVGMVKSLGGCASDEEAHSIGYQQQVGLMLKALHTLGFAKTEAIIRGGSTGLDEYYNGFSSDTYGIQAWMKAVAENTNATLLDPALYSGDSRLMGYIPAV